MNIPPQSTFLYKGGWSPTIDNIFMECLIRLKTEMRWTKSVFPSWFLLTAAEEIKTTMGVILSEVELRDRAKVLHCRYQIFKAVLRQRGAHWDMPQKAVIAPNEAWERLFKVNTFAGAYYYQEEPMYSQLACLFSLDDVKVEGEKEVVVISDNTEEILFDDLVSHGLVDKDEEVSSPAMFPGPNVRRKLFDEATDADDRESTTEPGIYFIDLAPDGQLQTRVEKGRALPKPTIISSGEVVHTLSLYASSCGSNSPIGGGLIFVSEIGRRHLGRAKFYTQNNAMRMLYWSKYVRTLFLYTPENGATSFDDRVRSW
ncbi:hypothetical protein AAHA92_02431 [Salvia divinorum]|uniref:Myb/SANT-like domain-containing protein n=1 Tax=Salvia divinorum TaxID=28513 RepID=A0ABD1IH68_SALDI